MGNSALEYLEQVFSVYALLLPLYTFITGRGNFGQLVLGSGESGYFRFELGRCGAWVTAFLL